MCRKSLGPGVTSFAVVKRLAGTTNRGDIERLNAFLFLDDHRGMSREPCVYMLASGRNGTLYVGVTSNLVRRVWQHRGEFVAGFTACYRVHDLVWYELHDTMESAIKREKTLKKWRRAWKLELIETMNPYWRDLYDDIT
jgi:putative endonuclease